MLRDKKRKHNNYIYEPKTLNLNENDVDMSPKPNINMWEAVRNTHDMNRSMLNVAYRKKR